MATTGTGSKFAVAYSSTSSGFNAMIVGTVSSTVTRMERLPTVGTASATIYNTTVATTSAVMIKGTIVTTGTGNLSAQLYANNAYTNTVYVGSYFKVTRIL